MKLSEVSQVDAMSSADSFIIEAGGSERRVNLETLKGVLASAVTTPPSTYTLEQNSNVAFDVSSNWAAYMYASYMKGYLFRVVAGKVYAAQLNDSWNAFADGTAIDNITKYETMVRVPKCHFKGEGTKMTFGGLNPVAGGHTFDSPEWVGAYMMYVENNVGHSRPNVAPTHSKKMTEFWAAAQQLGSNFGLANYQFQCLINAVYQAYYGNLNSQDVIGSGFQHQIGKHAVMYLWASVSLSVMVVVRCSMKMLLSASSIPLSSSVLRICGVSFGSYAQASASTWMETQERRSFIAATK